MGFLGVGAPLGWSDSLPYQAAVKRRGIRQFLQLLRQFKDYQGSVKWGDEIGRSELRTLSANFFLSAALSVYAFKWPAFFLLKVGGQLYVCFL